MAERGVGAALDEDLNLIPKAAIIADLLAPGANGHQAAECFDFSQRFLQFTAVMSIP